MNHRCAGSGDRRRRTRLLALFLFVANGYAADIPSPESVLGFKVGADRKLADWTQIVDYFRKLDEARLAREDRRRREDHTRQDGTQMVVDWYRKSLGAAWEGGQVPFLYHHYNGHDNNRDWYMFTQAESQATATLLYDRWKPQIVHDLHQMGSNAARIFAPPYVDPWEPSVDPSLIAATNSVLTYDSDNALLSGWLLGGKLLNGRSALVEVEMGQGKAVLFGFRPQYRAQSWATYIPMMNALMLSSATPSAAR